MKMYQMYVCEKCNKESKNSEEIELCEATHIGLNNLVLKREYEALKLYARSCSAIVSRTCNEYTRNNEELAIRKLIAFEKDNDMIID